MNVEEPWKIFNIKFGSISEKLDIWLDFERDSKFPCPKYGKLRNGKNITSNIRFGNGFIAIAKDNIKNKNHEIISSLFLNCSAYDTKEKVLRHINHFQYATYCTVEFQE